MRSHPSVLPRRWHLDERLSIQVLANTVGLSPCYFAHAFKQSTGLSPHDYLVQRRVQRVEELLSETDLPISKLLWPLASQIRAIVVGVFGSGLA
jgi:AraC-like DNA-binding protein